MQKARLIYRRLVTITDEFMTRWWLILFLLLVASFILGCAQQTPPQSNFNNTENQNHSQLSNVTNTANYQSQLLRIINITNYQSSSINITFIPENDTIFAYKTGRIGILTIKNEGSYYSSYDINYWNKVGDKDKILIIEGSTVTRTAREIVQVLLQLKELTPGTYIYRREFYDCSQIEKTLGIHTCDPFNIETETVREKVQPFAVVSVYVQVSELPSQNNTPLATLGDISNMFKFGTLKSYEYQTTDLSHFWSDEYDTDTISSDTINGAEAWFHQSVSRSLGENSTFKEWIDKKTYKCINETRTYIVGINGSDYTDQPVSCEDENTSAPFFVNKGFLIGFYNTLYRGSLTYAGNELVTVPAGTFLCSKYFFEDEKKSIETPVTVFWVSKDVPIPVKATLTSDFRSFVSELINYSS
jgi:hypothetical protein